MTYYLYTYYIDMIFFSIMHILNFLFSFAFNSTFRNSKNFMTNCWFRSRSVCYTLHSLMVYSLQMDFNESLWLFKDM